MDRATPRRIGKGSTPIVVQAGFSQGVSTPCAFYHAAKDVRIVVHGDDFTVLGTDEAIKWTNEVLFWVRDTV